MEVFGALEVCSEHFLKTVGIRRHPFVLLNLFVKRPHASSAEKNANGEITDISGKEIKVLGITPLAAKAPTMHVIKFK